MTTDKKPAQSDYLPQRLDTSVAARRYVLVNRKTDELGSDMEASPDYIARENLRLAIAGDPWRWDVMGGAA